LIKDYDITIVGGGLVGLTSALALQKFNGTVALIEVIQPMRQGQDEYDARTLVLAHGNVAFLKWIGIWDKISKIAEPITDIHISDKGHFGKSRLSAQQEQVPALGYVIEIPKLYNILLDAFTKIENIDHLCPAKVKNLVQTEIGWQLSIEHDDCDQSLMTKCVFAADGAQSSIRKILNIECYIRDYQQHAVVTNVSLDQPLKNIAYERFAKHGPVALLPLSNQRAGLVWTQSKEDAKRLCDLSAEDFLSELQYTFGYYAGQFTRVGRRVEYPLKSIWMTQQVHQQCVFIGNAAHTLHPVAGQGFNLSLRDLKLLAQLIGETNSIDQSIFDRYLKQRKPEQQRLLRMTNMLVHGFSSDFTPLVKLRNLALSVFDQSKFSKHQFTRYMMGLD